MKQYIKPHSPPPKKGHIHFPRQTPALRDELGPQKRFFTGFSEKTAYGDQFFWKKKYFYRKLQKAVLGAHLIIFGGQGRLTLKIYAVRGNWIRG